MANVLDTDIGGLIDAWDGLPNDLKSDLQETAPTLFNYINRLREAVESESLDVVLPCPNCGALHVDAPEPDTNWTNPPHKSHKCSNCLTVWRAADVPTTGVAHVSTRGSADSWPKQLSGQSDAADAVIRGGKVIASYEPE